MYYLKFLAALFVLAATMSCQSDGGGVSFSASTFDGDPGAVEQAEAMFDAIGGKKRWGKLRSLYIQATHEEPELEGPYKSEIWRSIDEFKIRIEQQSDQFHTVAVFSDEGGWVTYYHREETKALDPDVVAAWKHGHQHNVYVMLSRLAQNGTYTVRERSDGTIGFFEGETFLCAVELDEENRPYGFIAPGANGIEGRSNFTIWGTTKGMVHSAGGGPTDGSFSYTTDVWKPSNKSFDDEFGFDLGPPMMEDK